MIWCCATGLGLEKLLLPLRRVESEALQIQVAVFDKAAHADQDALEEAGAAGNPLHMTHHQLFDMLFAKVRPTFWCRQVGRGRLSRLNFRSLNARLPSSGGRFSAGTRSALCAAEPDPVGPVQPAIVSALPRHCRIAVSMAIVKSPQRSQLLALRNVTFPRASKFFPM